MSNLNWLAGQSPTPNKVDVQIDGAGRVAVENFRGTVDVIADVVVHYSDDELQQIVSRIKSDSVDSASLSTEWSVVVDEIRGTVSRHQVLSPSSSTRMGWPKATSSVDWATASARRRRTFVGSGSRKRAATSHPSP
ncbi:MAG: hypothetical protein HRT86_14810 [Ilumatobacteraceae bacterium]|nr:hypothetical protein [Ilumatobacteraceae bacterium]